MNSAFNMPSVYVHTHVCVHTCMCVCECVHVYEVPRVADTSECSPNIRVFIYPSQTSWQLD